MAKIEFPKQLRDLLEDSDLQAPIRGFADRVGEILADNKLPFFPDYTDHGIDHVNCVLKSEVELVSKPVWEKSRKDSDQRLLCDADAVVIVGGTLLHDFAMHLRSDGFRELISEGSRFQPLPWFKENNEGHSADRPWHELWADYVREARRFSDRQLTNIIGEESARTWRFHDLPVDAGQWERNHCLIVGEFIRRHHARLAHEIAIYGFPGLPVGSGDGQFPAMGKEEGHTLMRLADLIGLTARSHRMSLRVCKSSNLLTLLVEPLYGKEPGVGVRELMQNGADAVRELETWCQVHGVNIKLLDLPKQDGDVLVEFIKQKNGTWFLRVRDRGIGMRSDTIQNYFLRAGASFRKSSEWAKEFIDEKGQPRVIRAGRFGIGAFAVFLLGPSFKLWTRHADADKSMGYSLEASSTSQLIEIRRVEHLPIGTTVEVEVSSESVEALGLEKDKYSRYTTLGTDIDWFCWDWPKVIKRVIRGPKPEVLPQEYVCPVRRRKLPPEWSVLYPDKFDAVFWTFAKQPSLSCNGLKVVNPLEYVSDSGFSWPEHTQLQRPNIAVLDSAGNLPLTTQRYRLSQDTVPFIDELARDVLLSFIAHALICGPASQIDVLSGQQRHPLSRGPFLRYDYQNDGESPLAHGLLRWCGTSEALVPADPWLYTLLNARSCFIYGAFCLEQPDSLVPPSIVLSLLKQVAAISQSALPWWGKLESYADSPDDHIEIVEGFLERILSGLAHIGITALGPPTVSHVIVSESSEILVNLHMEHDRWTEIHKTKSGRRFFEAQTGELRSPLPLLHFLKTMEPYGPSDSVLFAAEIRTRRVESPKSMIAKIWNECLGARAIPFDPTAREALIADGKRHAELKRHIEAWQEMKRTGSKWVTGEKVR